MIYQMRLNDFLLHFARCYFSNDGQGSIGISFGDLKYFSFPSTCAGIFNPAYQLPRRFVQFVNNVPYLLRVSQILNDTFIKGV